MKADLVVKGIVLNRKLGKILLVKRSADDDVGADTWENCGGNMEDGEVPEEALRREIFEEVGISDITIIGQPYIAYVNRPDNPYLIIVYLCETQTEEIILSAEHQDYKWVDKEECKQIVDKYIHADFVKYGVYEMNWGGRLLQPDVLS